MLHFGEFFFQHLLRLEREVDAACQRAACGQCHLHGEIALVKCRDELCPEACEKQHRGGEERESHSYRHAHTSETNLEQTPVVAADNGEEAVGERRRGLYVPLEEHRRHHRHVGQREQQCADDAEDEGLCHRGEIFAFYSAERQYGEEDDEDDENSERRAMHHLCRAANHLFVHLLACELSAVQPPAVNVRHQSFDDYNRAVHHYAEVYRPEAHQVCRDTEYPHHDESEEHRHRNDRRHDDARPHVSEEEQKDDENNHRPLDEVADDSADVAADKFRAVEIRLYSHAFGQHLLHLRNAPLKLFRHDICVGTLEHHRNASDTLSLPVHRHGSEAFRRAERHASHVAHMHWHAISVCHHNLLYVREFGYHALRAYVVRAVLFLDIACARVLVVLLQCLEDIANGDFHRRHHFRINRYLVLFQPSAETVYLHNAGYS